MDILLNNLFSNAIRHNIDSGAIMIEQSYNKLSFRNSGLLQPLNEKKVFERFQKGKKSEGTGLGLAIVWNICNFNNWKIDYSFDGPIHTFQITF